MCNKVTGIWTDDDKEFIKKNYHKMSGRQLSESLGRTLASIKSKKLEMGLARKGWDKEEDKFLIDNYRTMSMKELATKFNRTELAIQNRKSKLNLTEQQKSTLVGEIPETEWIPINGYERYAISPLGLVLNKEKGIVLKNFLNSNGYVYVTLFNSEGSKNIKVHKIVGEHLVKKPKSEIPLVLNHIDGDKTNPKASNLEWVTHSENVKHAYVNGLTTSAKGSSNPKSKIKEQDAHNICKWLEEGYKTKDIISLSKTPLTKDIIGKIRTGKNWVDISKNYNIK